MVSSSRTFRIFVSSTFSDLKAERDVLQKYVFPRLRDLCMAYGCRFQAIDLRWGVSEEASLDQQTMKICLEELRRCQEVTPRPNFIVLLGDRYGWRPLPYEIPAGEFEAILARVRPKAKELLLWDEERREGPQGWYRRDDNAAPPVYVLQPREGEFREWRAWEPVERKLRDIMAAAIQDMELSPEARRKYLTAATEQEIVQGLSLPDAPEHVFCFFRTIENLPEEQSVADFIDLDAHGRLDEPVQRCLDRLRDDLARDLPGNLHFYEADWQGGGHITCDHLGSLPESLEDCLKLSEDEGFPATLCVDVWRRLSRLILAEIAKLEKTDPVEVEKEAHEAFGRERAWQFVGRTEILGVIRDYFQGEAPQPLAVWGESGSGKSALLAKAALAAQEVQPQAVVVQRFIGATPPSSDIRLLLKNLCRQVSRAYGVRDDDLPVEYRKLEEEFPKRLALATPDQPLILFLDALDQLSEAEQARRLYWLPERLPPYVRLVVSCPPGDVLEVLRRKFSTENLVPLTPMSVEEGGQLLDLWLRDGKRRLQPHQRQEVLDKFAASGMPLYLRLAFEEARCWRSYQDRAETLLSPDIPGIIRDLFQRLSEEVNHGQVMVSHSLGYLAAGKNGLTEDELLEVLSRDEKVMDDFQKRSPKSPKEDRLPVVVWSRLYFDLEHYLSERAGDGTILLSFYHRQMREVVEADYLDSDTKIERHRGLAIFFFDQAICLGKADKKEANLRKLAELPYQQTYGAMWGALDQTLCNIDFLEAKISGGAAYDLLADFSRVHPITQKYLELPPIPLKTLHRCATLSKALFNVIELAMTDPASVGAQLHLELQEKLGVSPDQTERAFAEELLKEIETANTGRCWLKRLDCQGRPLTPYLAQAALEQEYIHFLYFSPDSKALLFADWNGRIGLWRWQEADISFTSPPARSTLGPSWFRYAALLSEDQLLIMGEEDLWLYEHPYLWQGNLEKGFWRKVFTAEPGARLRCVAASPRAGYALLAQVGEPGNLLFRIPAGSAEISGRGRLPSTNPKPLVNHMAISTSGQVRAICFGDGEVLLSTGWAAAAHYGGVYHCEFIGGESHLATCGDDGTLAVWDLSTGKAKRLELLHGAADCFAYCGVRNLLAVGHRSGYVSLIELQPAPKIIFGFSPGVRNWILSLAFSQCGRYLAVGGRRGGVRVFEVDELLSFLEKGDRHYFHMMPFPPIEKAVFLPGVSGFLFRDESSRLFSSVPEVSSRYFPLTCGGFCLDAQRHLIIASLYDAFHFLDAGSGEPRSSQPAPGYYRDAMAISANGKWLAVLEAKQLIVYSLEDPGPSLKEHLVVPLANMVEQGFREDLPLIFCNGDRLLAVPLESRLTVQEESPGSIKSPGEPNHELKIFEVQSGNCVATIPYCGYCTALAEDADNELLALGLGETRLCILSNEASPTVKGHTIINSPDPGVVLCSTRDWQPLRQYPVPANDRGVTGIALNSRRDLLVATFFSGRIRLATLSHSEWLTSVALVNSARNVALVADDLQLKVVDDGAMTGSWPLLHVFKIMGWPRASGG